jgi:hypothetical protein
MDNIPYSILFRERAMCFLLGLSVGFALGFITAACCVVARERTLNLPRESSAHEVTEIAS